MQYYWWWMSDFGVAYHGLNEIDRAYACRASVYLLSRERIINRCIINATFTDTLRLQQSFVSLRTASAFMYAYSWILQRQHVVTVCYGLRVKLRLLNLKWNCCRRRDRCCRTKLGEKYLSVKYIISVGKYAIAINWIKFNPRIETHIWIKYTVHNPYENCRNVW